jgi:uncharacterized protein (UPF0548 family)
MKRLTEALQAAQPTYSDLGATLTESRPEAFIHNRYEADLGHGHETFQLGVDGLKAWEAHHVPGVRVFPEGQIIQAGGTVVVTLGTPFLALVAPCRIVNVVDNETRWGFAYGTLPGHPEQGEEAFVVSVSLDEVVRFEIAAFSRPADWLVRLSGPIGGSVQKGATNAYLRSRFVDHKRRDNP